MLDEDVPRPAAAPAREHNYRVATLQIPPALHGVECPACARTAWRNNKVVRWILLTTTALVASTIAQTSSASPVRSQQSFLIQASASFQRLGDFWVADDPTYRGAIRALGAASACHVVNGDATRATVAWRSLGVRMSLVTFGGIPAGKTGCSAPASIQVSTIRVTGKRWLTSRKLRIGDSTGRLRRLYPRAQATRGLHGWYGAGYWLVTRRQACLGDCGDVQTVTAAVLTAEIKQGRISSIVFVVGAQGE